MKLTSTASPSRWIGSRGQEWPENCRNRPTLKIYFLFPDLNATKLQVLGLKFKEGVKRQDRVNARVRYIEGDMDQVGSGSEPWLQCRPGQTSGHGPWMSPNPMNL